MKIRKKNQKFLFKLFLTKTTQACLMGSRKKRFQVDTSSHGVSTFKRILCLVFSTEVFNTEAKLSFAPLTIQNKKKMKQKTENVEKKLDLSE